MKESRAAFRLHALADPTRLRLLRLLGAEELSVGELVGILGMTQSRVSGHLGVLRTAGLVVDRRRGTSAFYSLAETGEAVETWNALRPTLPESEEAAEDRRRLAEALRHRREGAREFFDRVAAEWDGGRSESLGFHAGMAAVAGLLPRDAVILDLGTGTGALLPLLARYAGRTVAVDMSREMLVRARERAGAAGGAVDFVRGDVQELPLPGDSVDGVVANMILHHLAHPERAFREMARVLRRGGRGVVVDLVSHEETWLLEEEGHRWAGFEPAQVAAWCVDAGLGIPAFEAVATPRTGRWSRLEVFTARFARGERSGQKAQSPRQQKGTS
jgi:ArsR family transcriptional regulator